MTAPDAGSAPAPTLVLVRAVGGGDDARLCGELGMHDGLAVRERAAGGDLAARHLVGLERALRDLRDANVGGSPMTSESLRSETVVRARTTSVAAATDAISAVADAVQELVGVATLVEPSTLPLPLLEKLMAASPDVALVLLVGDPADGVGAALADDPLALGPSRRSALRAAVDDVEGVDALTDAEWRRAADDEALLALQVVGDDASHGLVPAVRDAAAAAVPEARRLFVEVVDHERARTDGDVEGVAEVERATTIWSDAVQDAADLAATIGPRALLLTHDAWRAQPDETWDALLAHAGAAPVQRPATLPAPPAAGTGGLTDAARTAALTATTSAAATVGIVQATAAAATAATARAGGAATEVEPVHDGSQRPAASSSTAPAATAEAPASGSDEIAIYQPLSRWSTSYIGAWRDIARSTVAHRSLIWQLFRRDLLTPYRTSYLGMSWLIIAPLLGVVQWIVVRGNGVLDAGDVGVPYPVYVLLGTTMWGLFLGLYQAAADTLRSSGGLLQQIRFPRESLVFKQMGQQLATFFAGMAVSLVVLIAYGIAPTWESLALPLVVLPVTLMATAIGLVTSMIIVVAVDLDRFLKLFWSLAMWFSPVIYTLDQKGGVLVDIATWNPLTYLVLAPRSVILDGTVGDPVAFAASSALAVVSFLIAGRLFYISEPQLVERLL